MKILIFNNDLMERTVIQQVLHANRHVVVTAGTSEAALQILQAGDIRFVIVDRVTTDMDESDFIKRLRALAFGAQIYIMLVATKVQDTDISVARTGVDDYLNKPVSPAELKTRVQIGERIQSLKNELIEARDMLEHTAMYDPLTNLLNPQAFLTLARGEIERARRGQAPMSILALMINNFAEITAQYGEAVGQDVLVVIAQALREKSRPYDTVGLFEKALFVIPLPFVIGQDAEKIAARMYKGIVNLPVTTLDDNSIQLNLGIAIVSATRVTVTTDMEMLIEKAKETLERFKRNGGGNRVDMVFVS